MAKKQTKRAAPKKKPLKKKPTSTALVPQQQGFSLSLIDPKGLMPAAQPLSVSRQIGQGISLLGELGLVTVKFTPEELAVINRPVDVSRIRWKPRVTDGPPEIPYLQHIDYTRWYNEAFGPGAWNLVPSDLPKKTGNTVSREYVLFVHGRPIAFAVGEQDYFENNKQQTYGDALEATMSSALRRTAKHLGFGLELWDKEWVEDLKRTKGVDRGQVDRDAVGRGSHRRQSQGEERPPAAMRHAHQDAPISQSQYGRLIGIIKKAGRTKTEVYAYLQARYGIGKGDTIKRSDYDAICAAVEKPGVLPDKDTQVREPDEILDADDIRWAPDADEDER